MNTPDDFRFAHFMIYFYESDVYVDMNGKLYIKYKNKLFNSKGYIGMFDDYKQNLYPLSTDKIKEINEYVNSIGSTDNTMIIHNLDIMNTPKNISFVQYMLELTDDEIFKSEIYMDIKGNLYIKYRHNIFNSNGHIGLFKTYESSLYKLTNEQIVYEYKIPLTDTYEKHFDDILGKFEENIEKQFNKFFKITNTVFVKQLSGYKVNLVKHDNGYKILLIIGEYDVVNSSLYTVESIYITLSKLGLTPYVHNHGKIEIYDNPYIYILTDYIPVTLKNITDLNLKNNLLKRALCIIYAIRGMGYYNQDLHDANFLYDNINDKVYAIDFTDITLDKEDIYDTFYLIDSDIYVSFEDIINNVYQT